MASLNQEFVNLIIEQHLNSEILKGQFGLERENVRVDQDGNLALTPHPAVFGDKNENPYIKTDFSESQVELITPPFNTIEEAFSFLEALQDIVTQELTDEYLWPSSNPPALPCEEEIPIAHMNDPFEDQYRIELAKKYGRKRQLLSGIHFNFSFDDGFLRKLYEVSKSHDEFKTFKDQLYLKVARNTLKYRWLLIFLTGASPVFSKSYIEQCVSLSDHLDTESRFFPNMNSLRNSVCGYRNEKPYYVSFNSIHEYIQDLQYLVQSKDLLSAKEYYSPVRIKSAKGDNQLQSLLENGIDYLELRMFDLNPLYKNGISLQSMKFIHLFLIYMLLKEDEPFNKEEQLQANLNVDTLMIQGIYGKWGGSDSSATMQEKALELLNNMQEMMKTIFPESQQQVDLIEDQRKVIFNPDLGFASILKSEINGSNFLEYHLTKAKEYAKQSIETGYKFAGFEDLELSTQLLLKAAVKRGIHFEIMDRDENFILLQKGDHKEYVKQATKTSLDSFSTVLIMENKIVTKQVLRGQGIQVPEGTSYRNIDDAIHDYEMYREKQIVIKPKSTNFGLGITIFTNQFTKEDFEQAFKIAFEHDRTVLLEEFVTGKEYRFLVMGNEVVGILHRVPANIIGDGIHTIEQLIQDKNKDPLRGKGYKTPLEKIQLGEAEKMFLKNQSKSLIDVPDKGETVYLRENSNISTGGDSIDFTDEIDASYKRIAVLAAKASGATFCGVDMMIKDINVEATDQNYSIIEINFNPAIHIHCYPHQGVNRKADDKILDLLFGNRS